MKHPTVIPRKQPGKSRQSKKARALREAQEQARERREAEEQSHRNDRAATSNRMTESIKPTNKYRKKSQRKKKRADRTHNYRRKALIKEEKLVNSYRIQRCPAPSPKSVTMPKTRGRRHVPGKHFQRTSATHVFGSIARTAALRETFLKKILKSLPKSKRAGFRGPAATRAAEAALFLSSVTETKKEREQEAECKFLFFSCVTMCLCLLFQHCILS